MSNQKFLKGTVILITANAISKILGAVFKIPLAHILKEDGMAIFNTAFLAYTVFLSFVISGFPTAISNIIAKHFTLKNYSFTKRIVNISTIILASSGLLVSLILFFGADFFAYALKDPDSALAIKIISPSVFFVALSTVYKGFFQGSVNMIPTAISQITESIVRLFVGFGCAFLFLNKGIPTASAAALFGITFGEILATTMLFLMYLYAKNKLPSTGILYSGKNAAREVLSLAIPLFITSAVISSFNMIDTAVVKNALLQIRFTPKSAENLILHYSDYTDSFNNIKDSLKLTLSNSRWLYGAYSGYALTVFNLPLGIIGSLGVSVLPVITSNITEKNFKAANKIISLALKITSVITFPFALGMLFFSKPVLNLLFNNSASAGLLSTLAPSLIFLSIAQLFSSVLHASGLIFAPAICSGAGIIIKIILDAVLIKNPDINIFGAPLSAGVAYFVMMLSYTYLIKKHLGFKLNFTETILKPLLCAIAMITFMYITFTPLTAFTGETPGFLISAAFSSIFYLLLLVFFKILNPKKM